MFWVTISMIIVTASAFLAVYRYILLTTRLQHFSAAPTIFLVQNRAILTPELIGQLISELPAYFAGLSFEILKKGQDRVLLMALPRWVLVRHPEIKVLEVEDYLPDLTQTGLNILCLQFTDPQLKIINSDFLRPLFDQLSLGTDESLFIQLVTRPISPNSADLDVNLRVIITAADAGQSAKLEQRFLELLKQHSMLIPNTKNQNASQIMNNFRARSFAKHESLSCSLTPTEVAQFLI